MEDFKGEVWDTEVGKATEKLAKTLIDISRNCDVMIQAQYVTLASLIMTRIKKIDVLQDEQATKEAIDKAVEKFKMHLDLALTEMRTWKSDAMH